MLKRKTHTISIRVSEQEYAELCATSEGSGAPSLSEYMRSTLFGGRPARASESGAIFAERLGHLASHVQDLNSRFEKLCAFVGLPEVR